MLHQFFNYLVRNQVILALFLIALGWLIIILKEIIVSIFLAYILMAAVLPIVDYLESKKFPKIIAVLIPYFGILIAIFLLILPLVPFVAGQIQSLIKNIPGFLDRSADTFGLAINRAQIENYLNTELETLGKSAVNVTTKVFGGLFSVITVFIVSLYLLLYEDTFKKFIAHLFYKDARDLALETVDKINYKLGAWFRGQIQLCFLIGLLSWIGLTILGLPFALPLALLAGILEIIPTLGPIISSIPAIIIAFTISPTMAITVIALYILIQALENQVIVPKVMQKAVGLNPVVVILGIMIGTKLMGIAGALLAIPFISFIIVIFNSLETKK
jgi:predicted PurR-regulated permease PerM